MEGKIRFFPVSELIAPAVDDIKATEGLNHRPDVHGCVAIGFRIGVSMYVLLVGDPRAIGVVSPAVIEEVDPERHPSIV